MPRFIRHASPNKGTSASTARSPRPSFSNRIKAQLSNFNTSSKRRLGVFLAALCVCALIGATWLHVRARAATPVPMATTIVETFTDIAAWGGDFSSGIGANRYSSILAGSFQDPSPDVTVAVVPSTSAEDGGADLVYTFTRNPLTAGAITVNFSVAGTADFTADYGQTGAASYDATSGSIVIPDGSTSATVTLDPSTDTTVESDETVILTVASGTGYNVGSPDSATGTITNDDTDVTVAVSPSSVDEDGASNLVYTFTRNGVTSGALTVNFTVSGTADSSSDYALTGATTFAAPNGTVTFADGDATTTVTIDPTTDSDVESDETAILTVASGTGYSVGSPDSATGTITNDDTDVTVAVSPSASAEDGGPDLVYTFTRNPLTAGAITVNFSVAGTADFTADYGQTGAASYDATSGSIVIPDGSTSATVTLDPSTDTTVESDETAILTVASGTGYNVGSPDSATGTITNDDTDVTVAVSPSSVDEDGASNLVYTFTRTGVTTGSLTASFSVGGTAVFSSDYTASGAASFTSTTGTVSFGTGNATADVTIDPTADISYEPSETVILTVTSGLGYNVGSPSAATGTITDEDAIPTALVVTKTADTNDGFCSLDDCSLREAISNANAISDTNSITFAIPAATDAGCNSLTGVCTIKPAPALPAVDTPVNINGYSQTGASANTLTVGSNAALKIELDGTNAGPTAIGLEFAATLSSVRGLVINRFGLDGIRLTLNTNNVVAGNFIGTDVTGTSAAGNGAHGVHLSSASTSTVGGTTAADRNVISGGTTSASQGIQIAGVPATGNIVKGNYIGTNAAGTATIPNAGDGVRIVSSPNTVIGGATVLEANVIAGNALDGIRVNGDSTIIKGNFIGTNSAGAVLGNGQAGIHTVNANNNVIGSTAAGEANTVANNGIKGVFIQSGTGNVIRSNSIYSNTGLGIDLGLDGITANDDGVADDADTGANNLQNFPVITAVVVGTPNTISGTLDSTPSQTFTIDFYSSPAGSCDPTGYGEGRTYLGSRSTTTDANGLGAFRFNPATLNANDVVTATATDSAGNTSEFSLCKSAEAIAFGQIKFAPANAPNTNDTETNSATHVVNIVVQRVGGADRAVSVDYEITNGTTNPATTPEDYSAANGTLTWANGDDTNRNIPITVNGDTKFELNETVSIKLVNAQGGATIAGDNPVTLTITNDDAMPTLSINDRSNNEGTVTLASPAPASTMTFTVTKTGSTAVTATVNFGTADGSATGNPSPCPSGFDYQTQTGSLSFLANETTKTITVSVCKDSTFEGNETFFVNLSVPTHATFTDDQGQGTILNDDIPSGGFVVTATDDLDDSICAPAPGHCSLREAITAANGSSTAVAINFAIPFGDPRHFYYSNDGVVGQVTNDGSHVFPTSAVDDTTIVGIDPDWPHSWWSILPTSQLQATTKQVFIDGYSQTGAVPNASLTTANNAVLRIELNGASAGLNATGLTISGGTSTVRGLVINRFQRDGSAPTPTGNGLSLPSGNNTVPGNFIGTDVSGTLDVGTLAGLVTGSGISTTSFNNVIGGATPDVVNLIAGNDRDGISFSNSNTNGIRGNLIGTKANGASALGNGASGLGFTGLGSVANTVGGPDAGQGNTIAFNGNDGISLSNANFGNSIRGNSIFSNGTTSLHLGIDLGTDGVTPNDDLDGDTGPNNLQNFPIITAAMVTGSTKTIIGTLNSSAGDTFIIDFYQSPACAPACGIGEGKTYLGSTSVTTHVTTGDVAFTFNPTAQMTIGQFVTATATSTGASGFDTSEFSARTIIADGSLGGAAGDIQFTDATYAVGEAGVTASITLTRVGGTNGQIQTTFTTSDGTATAGSDYTDSDQTVIFNEGESSKTITIPISNDSTYEHNETVNLSLGGSVINATGRDDKDAQLQALADPHAAVLTITNDDTAPTLAIDNVVMNEGSSGTINFVFTVTRSGGATAVAAAAQYDTANGTTNPATGGSCGTAGVDYGSQSGTVSVAPNVTFQTITIQVCGDTTVEANDTFFVNLSNPTDATITASQGLGTITNDDTDVSVAVSPSSVTEDGAPNLVYTFTRTGVITGALTVNFSVSGTATSGDYTQTGNATFVAGSSTTTVTVDPSVDAAVESDETVILTINSGAGYNVASPSSATGTITNDDTDVTLAVSPSSVAEDGATNLAYTFTRNGVTTGALTVNFSVAGSAAFGTDYTETGSASFTASSGTVTFGAGNATAVVTINPTTDLIFESDETVILTLASGTGYNVTSPNSATGTILNDDAAGGIVRFSAPIYNTTENSRFVTITVERVGDTSAAITVDYATPDDSETTTFVPCSTVNGSASPRCDFTTALGTLRFAAGETSKTFNILISQDNYAEGPESLALTLSNLTGGAVFGVPSSSTITIADDLSEPTTNPIDDAENFVRQHYHDFLNREPDADGLAFWSNQIIACGSDQACIADRRVHVSAAFYLSIEFQGTGYLVERLYKSAYGAATGSSVIGGAHTLPVPIVRFSEFLLDTQEIGQGVIVGLPGWETTLENNKAAFAARFVERSRFTTEYPLSMSAAAFVDELNTNAGNPLSPAQRDQLVNDLSTMTKTRAQVLRAVAEDSDLAQAEFNRAFVLMQYFGYLRRNPDRAPDSDHTGYDFWLTKLNQFNGNFVNAEMVKAFISSIEYRRRSAQ